MTYKLYGMPGSLYTGKARSYLIKQGIPFENRAPGEERFSSEIVPALGRWIIPVLEGPDGALVQDGSDIIRYFETSNLGRSSVYPTTPLHRGISHIFELFGGEGLLRPAMHYRWNFEANQAFLSQDFPSALAPTDASEELRADVFAMASQRMRKAMASFGVTQETIPAIERSYAEFLQLFHEHLAASPYLLGGRATLGDFGLIAPLYAHLARDPYPSQLMKSNAHRVWRWVERMNAPDQDAGEYGAPPAELFANDAVPETLKRLLRFIAADYLPEIEAFVAFTNQWLSERPELQPGTSGLPRSHDRVIGRVTFSWRGHQVTVSVLPYRLYLLQQLQDFTDSCADKSPLEELLAETGLTPLLHLRTTRRVERRHHLEVWSAER